MPGNAIKIPDVSSFFWKPAAVSGGIMRLENCLQSAVSTELAELRRWPSGLCFGAHRYQGRQRLHESDSASLLVGKLHSAFSKFDPTMLTPVATSPNRATVPIEDGLKRFIQKPKERVVLLLSCLA